MYGFLRGYQNDLLQKPQEFNRPQPYQNSWMQQAHGDRMGQQNNIPQFGNPWQQQNMGPQQNPPTGQPPQRSMLDVGFQQQIDPFRLNTSAGQWNVPNINFGGGGWGSTDMGLSKTRSLLGSMSPEQRSAYDRDKEAWMNADPNTRGDFGLQPWLAQNGGQTNSSAPPSHSWSNSPVFSAPYFRSGG